MVSASVRWSVQIPLREPLSSEEARRLAEETAPKYKQAPGLVRKYFVRGEDGLTWGGIYLWETRAQAEALFDKEWHERVTETYGSPPTMGGPIVRWCWTTVMVRSSPD